MRTCPDWPELLDRAPDLHFKHYTADELQLPHDIVLALGDVRLSEIEVCADTAYNVFNPAHTDAAPGGCPAIELLDRPRRLARRRPLTSPGRGGDPASGGHRPAKRPCRYTSRANDRREEG